MTDAVSPDHPSAVRAGRPWAKRGAVWVVLAIALVLRLALAIHQPTDEASLSRLPDQMEYLHTAQSFLEGRGFCFYDSGFADTVYAYRMPGYPLLIAACGGSVRIVLIVQAILDTSGALAAYLLARRLLSLSLWERLGEGSERGGAMASLDDQSPHLTSPTGRGTGWASLVALLFVAFNPFLIYFSSLLLSETLFTVMLIWSMFWLTSPRRLLVALGVLTLAASIYVRPGAIALPVLLAIAAALVRPNRPAKRSFFRIPAGASAILATVLLLLPWAIRNRMQLGQWVWMTTNDGITLYDGFNPAADGSSNQTPFRSWPELKMMGEVERSRYFGLLARQFVVRQPGDAAWLAVKKVERFWSPIPLSDEYGGRTTIVVVSAIFAIPLFTLAAAGIWLGPISRSVKLFLLLPAVYFTAVHAATVGSLRYRIPVDVPMSVLAAAGVAGVIRRSSMQRRSPATDRHE